MNLKQDFIKMYNITIIKKDTLNIANLFSLFAILFWFFGLLQIFDKNYIFAFNVIIIWVFFDLLDWYFARKFKTVSNFWKMLDNFGDLLLYVLSIVFFYMSIYWINYMWIIVISLFLILSIYRLCYFFEFWLVEKGNNLYYLGMPVYFNLIIYQVILLELNNYLSNLLLLILSFLMISRIKFRKFSIIVWVLYLLVLLIINNYSTIWF